MKALLEFWPVISGLTSALVLWVWWSLRREMASREEVRAMDARLIRLEAQYESAADRMDEVARRLGEASVILSRLDGDARALGAAMDRVENMVNLLMEHHMGSG